MFWTALYLLPTTAAALDIEFRDARSGAWVAASVSVTETSGTLIEQLPTSAAGTRIDDSRLRQSTAKLQLKVESDGYRSIQSTIDPHSPLPSALTFWLDPATAPADAVTTSWLTGRVYDPQRRAPKAGVDVTLESLHATTDAAGTFAFTASPHSLDDQAGRAADLELRLNGQLIHRRMLLLSTDPTELIIDVGSGQNDADHRQLSATVADDVPASDHGRQGAEARAPVVPPPASIRVGYASDGGICCVGGCSTVQVFSLETYTRRGLNDEWIASWTGDSLRAGAIAYRSYGAWHVLNPRTANYDICSSACCQVNDADTSANTNAAVNATVGIVLTSDGDPFRSEYSAENNAWDDPNDGLPCSNADLSCGNGFVGSPATGWPCLADAVATDRGCFGHGRGMSQWGTQRWSQQGQRWPWIVNHYYNDNNNATGAGSGLRTAELTSPLRIDSLAAIPTAQPGQTMSLMLTVSNLASEAHDPVYIGASIFNSVTGFLSDPTNDNPVRLEPGSQVVSRPFQLPPSLPPGTYDVLVSLYLDIDGNGAINAGDLALRLERYNGMLSVTGGGDALFADGFEEEQGPGLRAQGPVFWRGGTEEIMVKLGPRSRLAALALLGPGP